ncbi:hypothetical protein D5085_11985 [Ectothiorhodospiraceae bacterium BW-2]|nr:hypothetical protein D5085_11985 [Ectothiorhodospiraceae bacterium BW-2]
MGSLTDASSCHGHVVIKTRPYPGQIRCGDQATIVHSDHTTYLILVDGLGHGPEAERAALAAIECSKHHLQWPMSERFAVCNEALRSTRGVAMTQIELSDNRARIAGVGNVVAIIYPHDSDRHHIYADPGIVGGGYHHLHIQNLTLLPGTLLLLHTDGISEQLQLPPGLSFDPNCGAEFDFESIADQLLKQWGRSTDDAGLLLYYHNPVL